MAEFVDIGKRELLVRGECGRPDIHAEMGKISVGETVDRRIWLARPRVLKGMRAETHASTGIAEARFGPLEHRCSVAFDIKANLGEPSPFCQVQN